MMLKLNGLFDRHQKVALQLSSGKDSAACLWALQPYWDKLTVVWCNMGDPYPETLDYMKFIEYLVPKFLEVKGNSIAHRQQHGHPVDVLPIQCTSIGQQITEGDGIRLQSYLDCCKANFWVPMNTAMKQHGFTAVIRGQKSADSLKSPIRSGTIQDGIEYCFPIEDWTDGDVFEFLGEIVPESYTRGLKTSLDCRTCTAYVAENKGRLQDLMNIDSAAAAQVQRVHLYLNTKLTEYAAALT